MAVRNFCLLLILVLLELKSCRSAFNIEYPGVKICQGGKLADVSLHVKEIRKRDIESLASNNCTHLQGSLYIIGLRGMENIELDSIREIDGHLIIESNDIKRLSLKNLVIVRGYASKTHKSSGGIDTMNLALQVTGNHNLTTLDLSNLRSILNHDVLIDANPLLKYLPHRIKWKELFSDPNQKLRSYNISEDLLSRDKCNNACKIWVKNEISYCWGPSESQCQKKTLCESNSKECITCIFTNEVEGNCCDQMCVGGCNKLGTSNCMACRHMLDGPKCVESCPSPYIGSVGGTKQNKDFKYYSGSFCSKKCPDNMLAEAAQCVPHCSDGFFKNKTNHCIKCYDEKCKKEEFVCDMTKMSSHDERDRVLSKKVLEQLTNCKKIRGYIVITNNSFTKYNVTVELLYKHLRNLEDLEGGFTYFMDNHLNNLTFLYNLKIFRETNLNVDIQGSASYNKFSITTSNLSFLGLKSLKKVTGRFIIGKNDALCYVQLPWNEIVEGRFLIIPKKCKDEKCDSQCSNKGCWMSGNQWCFECKTFEANGQCVSNCSSAVGYFLSSPLTRSNGTCDKCHEECGHTCNGTSQTDCIGGCMNKQENGACVRNCSFTNYEEKGSNKCLPCSNDCATIPGKPKCSGPSNEPGIGGCNRCNHILISSLVTEEKIVNCVSVCPNRTYARVTQSERITQFFPGMGYVCEPCHSNCKKCVGRRSHKEDCLQCDKFWDNNFCVKTCPMGSTFGAREGKCLKCNSSCSVLEGCSGPNSWQCNKCRSRRVNLNATTFNCQRTCPDHKKVEEMDLKTNEILCLSIYESSAKKEELRRNKTIIIAVLVMLMFVILIITTIVICLRKKASTERAKADLNARYSNLTEPNSKDENAFSQPPNMGRLVIISIEDLIFEDATRPLGFGAFGYVYKGKWKIPKEENLVIRKSAGEFFLPVAIKVIKNIGNSESEAIMQEAKIMASVSHMHCLRFIGICLSYEKPCLVTAFVKDGSLDKYLFTHKSKISSLIMLSWAEQIADGMLYLTKRGIIHRDLAARNVLVSRLECVQITDFGLSKMLETTNEREIVIKSGKVPIRWLAIETLLEGRYSYETDVWAYGVTLWEIFTFGKVPYEDQATHDISDFVMKGGRLSQPDICSLDVYIVMVNCWLESPNLRPDFEALMKTFIDYCKNPGRYLSIQGDPFEIPSPNNIEMTNFNNHYGDQFNFTPGTAETMLPLLNRESVDIGLNDFQVPGDHLPHGEEESRELLSPSDQEDLPTRTSNKTSNLFKRFHEKNPPNNTQSTANSSSNNHPAPRLVPLASLEEPSFRGSSIDDDPRYVADPTDKQTKARQEPLHMRPQLSQTPRFHSNPYLRRTDEFPHNLPPAPKAPNLDDDADGYLEPVRSPSAFAGNDADGYLEPVGLKKPSVEQDDYMTPSYNNSPRESLLNMNNSSRAPSTARGSARLPSMDEERSPSNLYFPQNLVDDEYLEPQPKSQLIKS